VLLIAPNGKPSNLTPEQYKLVRTPEFKAFFGDWENDPKNSSKVIDGNGEPLIMYSGSPNQFTVFKANEIYVDRDDKEYKSRFWFTIDKQLAETYSRKATGNIGTVYEAFLNIKNPKYDFNLYAEDNQDGSIELINKKIYVAIATLSEQIKLADGTNTTFDANNDDIRYEEGGKVGYKVYVNGEYRRTITDENLKEYYLTKGFDMKDGKLQIYGKDIVFENGGQMNEQTIQCVKCDWTWSTADSDEADKYVCHKCGFDNSLFYDTDILKTTLTIQEIAEKHNVNIDYVIDQLIKGAEHEMEHTDRMDIAKKIALHHVAETPDYYEKLEKMELEDGGELPKEVILEDNSLVEIEIIEYLKQQMAESQEIMHCNDSRVFKTMICKTKIEIAEKRLSETENPEEQNVWNECIIIWSDTMKDIFENNIPVREYKDGGTPCGCGSVYEKGGLAYGNSHDKGGMPLEVSSTGQKIEIEGGEGVVNKRSMQITKKVEFQGKKYTPCEVVSKINEMGGGVKFKCSDVNEIIAEDGHF
jgi:hypothetical protein